MSRWIAKKWDGDQVVIFGRGDDGQIGIWLSKKSGYLWEQRENDIDEEQARNMLFELFDGECQCVETSCGKLPDPEQIRDLLNVKWAVVDVKGLE